MGFSKIISKKIFVFLACMKVLVGSEILIHQNISVTAKIESTLFVANPQINESEKLRNEKNLSMAQRNQIIQTFNLLNQEIQKSGICNGGGFEIAPYYTYENGSKEQMGYQSHWNIICEFNQDSLEAFNAHLNFIQNQIDKNPYLVFTLPSIHKGIDQNKNRELDEDLNVALLQKAQDVAKKYAKTLRKRCEIKKITLAKAEDFVAPLLANESLESIVAPTAKLQNKTIQGEVAYRCY
ncbi:hypothetical protein [Helicobacter mesocricetorum]|uniref:hypothetical protein n=1 Tax=Helicobacter mesocricetorum TaxID=87012 RepID=UPI0013153B06|nr:hypothetical protein [Helicobacter mesocricetorum]